MNLMDLFDDATGEFNLIGKVWRPLPELPR
jgi:hypothetical protein